MQDIQEHAKYCRNTSRCVFSKQSARAFATANDTTSETLYMKTGMLYIVVSGPGGQHLRSEANISAQLES